MAEDGNQRNDREEVDVDQIKEALESGEVPPREQIVSLLLSTEQKISQSLWVAPIPPPEVIEAYERIHPGAAEVIFSSFQKQTEHRITLERMAVEGNEQRSDRGLWMAFVVFIALIALAAWLAYLGSTAWGIGMLFIAIAAVVGSFYHSRRRQTRELQEKDAAVPEDPFSSNRPGRDRNDGRQE